MRELTYEEAKVKAAESQAELINAQTALIQWIEKYIRSTTAPPKPCIWTYAEATPDSNDGWMADCGSQHLHRFGKIGPTAYGYLFCPHCGKPIAEEPQ